MSPSYRVFCRKIVSFGRWKVLPEGIFKSRCGEITLMRDVILPFVPFPGLVIREDNWECKVVEVSYDLDTDELCAWAERDYQEYTDRADAKEAVQEVIRDLVELGWWVEYDPCGFFKEAK